jgi:hypothetical protein
LSSETLNAALNRIAHGNDHGQRYSAAGSAKTDRAAWRVVRQYCPTKTEGQCRAIINAWVKSGLLIAEKYSDLVYRKEVDGLSVDDAKRPE